MFSFCQLGLKLVPLFSESGDVKITFLESGGKLRELLVLGSLFIVLGFRIQV